MPKTAIYGAGAFGKIFYDSMQGCVDFFIDDFSDASHYCSLPVLKLSDTPKNTKIYISVLQHAKTIERNLLSHGFTNIVNFTQSAQQLPNLLKNTAKTNYLWLVEDTAQLLNETQLQKVNALLSDEKSQKILEQIIQLRKTLNPQYYITPQDTEYFPSDIPILDNLEMVNFIDCGAYTGDTIEELMLQSNKVNYTLSFEPDNTNLRKLHTTLSQLKKHHPTTNFFTYPTGVYSTNTILKFANNGVDSSASLDTATGIEISVVSLDNVIFNAAPNFIKMDIEGAEAEALKGALKTIQKYKPNLAICLYHKPQDLWELPLLIQEIEPSYDMYIRVHEDMCLSTVLYCIPKRG